MWREESGFNAGRRCLVTVAASENHHQLKLRFISQCLDVHVMQARYLPVNAHKFRFAGPKNRKSVLEISQLDCH